MKIVFFILVFFVLGSCNGTIETCTTESFEGVEMDKISPQQYRFFNEALVSALEPAITYKFKNKSKVSFAKGKDYTLLSFDVVMKDDLDTKNIQIKEGESKIQLGKCYSKCAYLGRTLKFRLKNTNSLANPILKIMSSGLKKKIVDSNYIYMEGVMQNLGLYVEKQEFIFLPHDDSSIDSKEDFYMKVLLVRDNKVWMVYVFYSKSEIKTNVLDYKIGSNVPVMSSKS